MKRSLILAFIVALAAVPASQAGNGKVLAVKFDADVNPVTQKWLSDRIDEGAKYDALVVSTSWPPETE